MASGDNLTLLNVYNRWRQNSRRCGAWSYDKCGQFELFCRYYEKYVQHRSIRRARDVRDQLAAMMERVEIALKSTDDTVAIRKCITAGCVFG